MSRTYGTLAKPHVIYVSGKWYCCERVERIEKGRMSGSFKVIGLHVADESLKIACDVWNRRRRTEKEVNKAWIKKMFGK